MPLSCILNQGFCIIGSVLNIEYKNWKSVPKMLPDSKQNNVAFKLSRFGLAEGYFSGAFESKESHWTYKMLWPSYNSIFQRKRSLMGQVHLPHWSSAQHKGCVHSDVVWKAQRMWDCPRPMLTLQPFTCKAVTQLNGSLTPPEWIKDSWPPCFPLWTDSTTVARLGKYKGLIWSQEEREKPIFYYKVLY